MKKNKGAMIALGALVCAAAVFALIFFVTRGEVTQGSKALTIQVVHGNGESKEFTFRTDAEYLDDALLEHEEIGVISEDGPYGMYIVAVDGESVTDETFWGIKQNGVDLMVGASEQPIADGEHYELVLTEIGEW